MTPHETTEAADHPGYERRDVRISALVWLALSVLLGTTAVFVVLWLLLGYLETQARRTDPQLSPLAESEQSPPAPQLQQTPVEDLQTLIQRDEAILSSYGWADKEQQTVRIPVSRAMDLAVERGLPPLKPSDEQ
jgi:hypothetical protein